MTRKMKDAVRAINVLERRIIRAEDDADAMLWEQAERAVGQLDGGLSQRALAAQWLNARTGKPYDEHHVRFVRKVFEQCAELTPRPRFREAYNELANSKPSKPNPDTVPFHWINAANDVHRLCASIQKTWPEAHPLLPWILRKVAEDIEREEADDDRRGDRTQDTDTGPDCSLERDVPIVA